MKLFRLHTENSNIFKGNVQSSLILPKQSQVALLNMNFEKQDNVIVINNSNDKLSYTIGDYIQTVTLTHASYDSTNAKNMLRDIEKKLNESSSFDNKFITGMRWDVRFKSSSPSNTIAIDTDYENLIDPQGAFRYENDGIESTAIPAYAYSRKADNSSEGTANSAIYSNQLEFKDEVEHLQGSTCCLFKMTIDKLSDNGDGVYIGISNTKGENMAEDYSFVTNKISYGIYAKNNTTNYQIITPSGLVTTTTAIEQAIAEQDDNDVILIGYNLGKIKGIVYQKSTPAGIVLFDEVYDPTFQGVNLYPILGVYQQTDVRFRHMRICTEVQYDDLNNQISYNDNDLDVNLSAIDGVPTQQLGQKNPMNFNFQNEQQALILGYRSPNISVGPNDLFRLTAQNRISFVDTSEAYIVELMNLKLDSFDSFTEQRQSIIAFIQNSRQVDQPDVLFEANNPIFIDLNNDYEIPLRNIDARILTSHYQPVEIQGEANIVLLFKEKGE